MSASQWISDFDDHALEIEYGPCAPRWRFASTICLAVLVGLSVVTTIVFEHSRLPARWRFALWILDFSAGSARMLTSLMVARCGAERNHRGAWIEWSFSSIAMLTVAFYSLRSIRRLEKKEEEEYARRLRDAAIARQEQAERAEQDAYNATSVRDYRYSIGMNIRQR